MLQGCVTGVCIGFYWDIIIGYGGVMCIGLCESCTVSLRSWWYGMSSVGGRLFSKVIG